MSEGWSYFLDFKDQSFELKDGEQTIGRSRACDVPIDDASVSRRHVVLTTEADKIILRDLGSSNGTFINGTRVQAQGELRHLDSLGLGDADISVRVVGTSAFETVRMSALSAAQHGDATLFLQKASSRLAQEAMSTEPEAEFVAPGPHMAPPAVSAPSHMSPPPFQPTAGQQSVEPASAPESASVPESPFASDPFGSDPFASDPFAPDPSIAPSAPSQPGEQVSPVANEALSFDSSAVEPLVFDQKPVESFPVAASPSPAPIAPPPVAPAPIAPPPVVTSPVVTSPVVPSPVAPPPLAPSPVAAPPVAPPPVAASPIAPSPVAAPQSPVIQPPVPAPPALGTPGVGSPKSAADVRLDHTTGDLLPSLDGFDSTMGPEMLQAIKHRAEEQGGATSEAPAFNPYGPPSQQQQQQQTAGFGIRLLASILDGVWVIAAVAGASLLIEPQFGGLIGSVFSLLVVLFGWAVWGTTPGKRACKLYLSAGGGAQAGIGFPRALARIVGYLVSAIPLGIGFLVIAFSASKRGWHDRIAGTEVHRQA